MREIKFRAWDGERMRESVGICDSGNAFHPVSGCEKYDWKVMQFTGLKDRKGKDIYEDDIVIHPGGRVACRVVFEAACFGFRNKQGAWEGQVRSHLDCEVIGNIHESPELLETK